MTLKKEIQEKAGILIEEGGYILTPIVFEIFKTIHKIETILSRACVTFAFRIVDGNKETVEEAEDEDINAILKAAERERIRLENLTKSLLEKIAAFDHPSFERIDLVKDYLKEIRKGNPEIEKEVKNAKEQIRKEKEAYDESVKNFLKVIHQYNLKTLPENRV